MAGPRKVHVLLSATWSPGEFNADRATGSRRFPDCDIGTYGAYSHGSERVGNGRH